MEVVTVEELSTVETLSTIAMAEFEATTSAYLEEGNGTDLSTAISPGDSGQDLMCSQLVMVTTIALLTMALAVNFIALAAVSCDPTRRSTRANIYAASFFIAEIAYSLGTLLSHYQRVFLDVTDYEDLINHGYMFVEFMTRGAMVISLIGVVVDRYRAISNMTSYCPRQSLCVTTCHALAGWAVSALLAVPVLFGLTDYWYTSYGYIRPVDVYNSLHSALLYFIPLLIFSIALNVLMCRIISSSNRRSLDSFAAKGNERQRATRRLLSVGVIATVVVFASSWLICLSVRAVDGYFPPSDFDSINMAVLRLAGDLIAYGGLSICPVLVCIVCARYRSLDSQRHCTCCSETQNFKATLELQSHTWPSAKQNPYYL